MGPAGVESRQNRAPLNPPADPRSTISKGLKESGYRANTDRASSSSPIDTRLHAIGAVRPGDASTSEARNHDKPGF
jgi:hypothetical protein